MSFAFKSLKKQKYIFFFKENRCFSWFGFFILMLLCNIWLLKTFVQNAFVDFSFIDSNKKLFCKNSNRKSWIHFTQVKPMMTITYHNVGNPSFYSDQLPRIHHRFEYEFSSTFYSGWR